MIIWYIDRGAFNTAPGGNGRVFDEPIPPSSTGGLLFASDGGNEDDMVVFLPTVTFVQQSDVDGTYQVP